MDVHTETIVRNQASTGLQLACMVYKVFTIMKKNEKVYTIMKKVYSITKSVHHNGKVYSTMRNAYRLNVFISV